MNANFINWIQTISLQLRPDVLAARTGVGKPVTRELSY